mmetsp:Transcript_107859/g.300748  ORF Transcript_107859/g.300748 Transcript_107859/m.300748 type:complete len:462 (-) Transcript_107859:128-1513(-)
MSSASVPLVLSEEIPYEKEHGTGELDLMRPMGGPFWWNSLYWTNFPPLACFDQKAWDENPDSDFVVSTKAINTDQRLAEQYVSFQAAREDLCTSRSVPKSKTTISVECMQYEGVRDVNWNFPLSSYIPKRDNHQPYDVQARRFYDNNVIHLGLNAEEFSFKFQPVSELDACITIADYIGNPSWGYYHALLRIGGWPYRIKKIGTFEGQGDGGHLELNIGLHHFDDKTLWTLLEGPPAMAPTGPNGEMEAQGNQRSGFKFWAQLLDLDWLGPKIDENKFHDPEIAHEKGYVWFTVVDTIIVPSTGKKGVKIQLLDEGILPAWLDLNYMEVFAGDKPLGFLNEMECTGPPAGLATVYRMLDPNSRKVVVENEASRLVFNDPFGLQVNDFCDMGWAIMDCGYKGATTIKLAPSPGKWTMDVGDDEGMVEYKASGPPPLAHGEGEFKYVMQAAKSACGYERRLVM